MPSAIVIIGCPEMFRSEYLTQDFRSENPGLLPDGITIAILKMEHASRPRNKKIAWLLFLSGYIEQWGSGTLNMLNACGTEGSPEPEFKEAGDDFVVTFDKSPALNLLKNPEFLNERQNKSIQYLMDHAAINSKDYSDLYECTSRTARRDLSELVRLGIVTAIKIGKQVEYSLHDSLRTNADKHGQGV
jgi:ATP-dependent DNA helicase RecG